MVVSSFCFTFIRSHLQYNKAPWDEGIFNFLTQWLINYLAIGVVAVVVGAMYLSGPKWLFYKIDSKSISKSDIIHNILNIVFLTVLVGSIFTWFVIANSSYN